MNFFHRKYVTIFGMGIIDDNTRKFLRDGRVLDAMHKMVSREPSNRGVKVEVNVPSKDGNKTTHVIIRRISQ